MSKLVEKAETLLCWQVFVIISIVIMNLREGNNLIKKGIVIIIGFYVAMTFMSCSKQPAPGLDTSPIEIQFEESKSFVFNIEDSRCMKVFGLTKEQICELLKTTYSSFLPSRNVQILSNGNLEITLTGKDCMDWVTWAKKDAKRLIEEIESIKNQKILIKNDYSEFICYRSIDYFKFSELAYKCMIIQMIYSGNPNSIELKITVLKKNNEVL